MRKVKIMVAIVMAMIIMTIPVCAEGVNGNARYNNINTVSLTIDFDSNRTVYCTLLVDTQVHGTGISGLVKLFDSDGVCLAVWPVSDYEQPIFAEFTYQGVRGETYTATFGGYAYGTTDASPDRVDLSATGTCR